MNASIPLVIATRNPGKSDEIKALLEDFPLIIKNLDDFGPLPPVEEDGLTFEANAYKKASFTARVLGYPALADDSGLVVEALAGAPGVHSARYGGPGATDAQRCAKLLEQMSGQSNRKAAFECVLSLAVPAGPALTYEAHCEGFITTTPRGRHGFGYDPIFYYPPCDKTFAEMTRDEKSRISHRGKALRELQSDFDKIIKWIQCHMPVQRRFPCASAQQTAWASRTDHDG